MNILFISFDADPPFMGGVCTVTHVLAKCFIQRGYTCSLAFLNESNVPSIFFKQEVYLSEKNKVNVLKFFNENKFDIILNQLPTRTCFRFLLSLPLGDCRIISAYHSRPMLQFNYFENLTRIFKSSNDKFYQTYTLLKFPLIPILNSISRNRQIKKFKEIHDSSDRVQLLSKRYFRLWNRLVGRMDTTKLISIGNPLVFDEKLTFDELQNKEKLIVIVCHSTRLKRVDIMLKIWSKIEQYDCFDEWNLEYIGGGEEFENIISLAKKLKLKRVKFLGYKNPVSHYKRASLMLMTSKYEGWPMVLMEGMQMGVVPIVYETFESIHDIITNNSGIIIQNNNIESFVSELKSLMMNNDKRIRLATNAINVSKRFAVDQISERYFELFTQLKVSK